MVIFFTIAVIGFLWIVLTSAFGHASEAAHDFAHDMTHGDTGDHEPSHESGGHIISIFSSRVVATFLMGFGGVGGICRVLELNYLWSCLGGIAAGFIVGVIAWGIMEFFARQQANSVVGAQSLVGGFGTVMIPIEGGKAGQVSILAGGSLQAYLARSSDGKTIQKGRRIRVVSATGSDLSVVEVAAQ